MSKKGILEEDDVLDLQSDIYSFTFYKFIYCKNEVILSQLMVLIFVTLGIQGGIIILLFMSDSLDKPVFVGNAALNLARIVSAIIMHLSLFPEVRLCMEMLQYITYKGHTFYEKHVIFPCLILVGKFAGATMTEALTIYTLTRKDTILGVINGYIATFLIGKIGNVMAATVSSFNI